MSENKTASTDCDRQAQKPKIALPQKSFYELLDAIRRRPAMYLGKKSLRDFHAWLGGYKYGKLESGVPPDPDEMEFKGFDEFVCEKYRWHDVGGWAAKIAYYNRDDASALDEFFKILDEFRVNKKPAPNEPTVREG